MATVRRPLPSVLGGEADDEGEIITNTGMVGLRMIAGRWSTFKAVCTHVYCHQIHRVEYMWNCKIRVLLLCHLSINIEVQIPDFGMFYGALQESSGILMSKLQLQLHWLSWFVWSRSMHVHDGQDTNQA